MKLKRIIVSAASAVALAVGMGAAASAPAQAGTNYKSTGCYVYVANTGAHLGVNSWVNSDGSKTYHYAMTAPWVSRTGPDQYFKRVSLYIGGLKITSNLADGYMTFNGSGAQVNRSVKAYWNLWTNGMEAFGPDLKSCTGSSAI